MQVAQSRRLFEVWLSGLSRIEGRHKLIVTSNADCGSDACEHRIRDWAAGRSDVTVAVSLDTPLYLSALAHCDCYVGNSSSGVIETPVFGTPAVMVGPRQEGRPRAANVLRLLEPTVETLSAAVAEQIDHGRFDDVVSPYGDGRASQRICDTLVELRSHPDLMLKRLVVSEAEVVA
jgi:UDP-N-acetylglucosamine 2-epimerase